MKPGLIWRLVKPSSWPITGKLAFAFLITALIPILLTAYYGLRETSTGVRATEQINLEQIAVATSGRLDQMIRGTRKTLKFIQRSDPMLQFASHPGPKERERLVDLWLRVVGTNEDLELVMLVGPDGKVSVSTSPDHVGESIAFRRYFTEAIKGGDYVSSFERGALSGRSGVFFSAPVRDQEGTIKGVLVVKLIDAAIAYVMDDLRAGAAVTPFIIDEYGVIIYHPDRSMLYRPLGALQPADVATLLAERRYPVTGFPGLGLDPLAATMRGANEPGHAAFVAPWSEVDELVGFAPVQSNGWTVGISEPRALWEAPLRAVFMSVIAKVLMVAFVAGLFAFLIFTRDVIRPIRSLIVSAQRVKGGDYADARAVSVNEDEIGELATTFNTMVDSIVARERERDMFGRVVSPEVREKLLSGNLKLGGENRRVTVLFSDIRDFTSLFEGMPPEAVVELLNEYMTEMTSAVQPHFGYVNNFLGDAIVVIFGAPYDHPDSSWGAIQAAFDMRTRLDALNARRRARGEAPIKSGIGIATGVVVVGQMGSLDRFTYTVIGDAVNVAARLEALTKEFEDNPILVNEDTADDIKFQDDIELDSIGDRQLRGRAQAIRVYKVARKAGSK